ncbi:hypothetical protein [Bdellovibrio sp. HCB2-146]|uniref:hypothetical protein n=1 Tax=Bdellovibrio sp. HCB2-146 TaxID=3394362 RepID=UPI0039BCDE04
METQLFNDWLELMSDTQNALRHPMGTSIWIDGIETLQTLTSSTFFKIEDDKTEEEKRALRLLSLARREELPQDNFWVSGHSCLMMNSPLYRNINSQAAYGKTPYRFVEDDTGNFCPWTNSSELGKKFYSVHEGQIRIPFYTFNHENTHLFFKDIYSNLPVSDHELYELIVLVEWFCISADLILAYDLMSTNQYYAFKELCRVPYKQGEENSFTKYCKSIESANNFSNEFRKAFLDAVKIPEVFDLISEDTLAKHRSFAKEVVVQSSRKIPSQMSADESRALLYKLKTASLSDLVFEFLGVQYEENGN